MSAEQLLIFAVWLALALLGGVLIVVVWERLRTRYSASDTAAAQPSAASSNAKGQCDA